MNRLSVVALGVRDMKKSFAFYKALGFSTKEQAEAPEIVFFHSGGARLELCPMQTLLEDANISAVPAQGFCGITLAYNVRTKQEVNQSLELARKAGAKILKEPQDAFWGGYHAYFADPDGYPWEIVWFAEAVFDENDIPIF